MKVETRLLKLAKNTIGKDFFVGDIHGCHGALMQQLKEIEFDRKTDRLICVGDLINRGPDSISMIELLKKPWFFSTLGNHEYLFLKGIRDNHSYHKMLFLKSGGEWISRTKPNQWSKWFELIGKLPLAIEITNNKNKKIGVIHADFIDKDWNYLNKLNHQKMMECIWSRDSFKSKNAARVKNIDWMIHGHSIVKQKTLINNHIFIDSGAYKGNKFIILDADELD